MRASPECCDFIRATERLRLQAYQDAGGVWTIGYGHTGPDVCEGIVIAREHAEELFIVDVGEREDAIQRLVTGPLTQPRLDGLVPLVFNIGIGAFAGSTLLRLLNARAPLIQCASQFARWCHVAGAYNEGLAMRRAAEVFMFAGGSP